MTPISLPSEWEVKNNPALLAQAIRVYTDISHVGLRKAQTRAEVKRTGKKLYSQKGTGGARHGSRRAPNFVGGGVALGPRPVHRDLKLSVAMKRKATGIAMSLAVKENRVVALDLSFKKTKEAQDFIGKVFGKKDLRVTFVFKKENLQTARFVKNIKNVRVVNFMDLNMFDIFFGGKMVLDKSIFAKEKKTS